VDQAEKDRWVNDRLKDLGVGAGLTAGVASLLLLATTWARWRGKRHQKKRTPESPGFSLSIKRNLFGRRRYQAKYVA
jgi:hypothetical protein